MERTKEKFGEYILSIGLSEKTKSNYISALNNICEKISEIQSSKNFFNYDLKEYDDLIKNIKESNQFKDLNEKTNNTYSAAIRNFEQFLKAGIYFKEVYLSIKISNPQSIEIVKAIKNKEKNIVISQLNQLKDMLRIGQIVFMVPFGDKVPWDKGICGIAKISKLPYNFEGKNFKINVDMFCSFDTIHREDFIPYIGTYDAADIGPSTKGSQNQAIKQITFAQTVSILRAIIEMRPDTRKDIEQNVAKEIMDLVYGKQIILKHFSSRYLGDVQNINLIGINKIYYGIPGCGKSYHIEHNVLESVDKERNVFRTTFYLDYSNSDFIGQIYPVIEKNENKEETVTYKAIPGPFTKALTRAYENLNSTEEIDTMIYLVVEEINRGNATAIFGDLFQLLDRLDKNYDGRLEGDSEYPINNEFIEGYLKECEVTIPYGQNKIFIPHNLTILATMNTSDQNVFPLDTAFKRRWDRERIVADWKSVDEEFKDMYIPFTNYTWEKFATTVNKKMTLKNDEGIILEDKQLGPYFINKNVLVKKSDINNHNDENKRKLIKFVNNVIDYLYNDATKFEHTLLFKNDYTCYDEIYNEIVKFGENNEFKGEKDLALNVFDNIQTSNDEEESDSEEN